MELTLLIQALLSIITATMAAFFGSLLALQRFRNEKWWERQVIAYSDLVEALHARKWHVRESLSAEEEYRELSEEYSQQLSQESRTARAAIWRIAESSSFLLSAEVMQSIETMQRKLNRARTQKTLYAMLDEEYGAIDTCLIEVKRIGIKELGIKRR